MDILICVKRVPATGGQIILTGDAQDIDTRFLGFTVSPHEECAVEEALRLVEKHGGTTTAVTLGPARAYGMDTSHGSVARGKVANLVVWSGDPFEFATVAEHVFVKGRAVKRPSRQDELTEKYKRLLKPQ